MTPYCLPPTFLHPCCFQAFDQEYHTQASNWFLYFQSYWIYLQNQCKINQNYLEVLRELGLLCAAQLASSSPWLTSLHHWPNFSGPPPFPTGPIHVFTLVKPNILLFPVHSHPSHPSRSITKTCFMNFPDPFCPLHPARSTLSLRASWQDWTVPFMVLVKF